jgi:hypothetical protein
MILGDTDKLRTNGQGVVQLRDQGQVDIPASRPHEIMKLAISQTFARNDSFVQARVKEHRNIG